MSQPSNTCINLENNQQVCNIIFILLYLQEVHDYLKTVCPDLHITRGEYDEDTRYPDTKTLTIGQFKLGVCHGHQVRFFFLSSEEGYID